jgi:hypothetical protein
MYPVSVGNFDCVSLQAQNSWPIVCWNFNYIFQGNTNHSNLPNLLLNFRFYLQLAFLSNKVHSVGYISTLNTVKIQNAILHCFLSWYTQQHIAYFASEPVLNPKIRHHNTTKLKWHGKCHMGQVTKAGVKNAFYIIHARPALPFTLLRTEVAIFLVQTSAPWTVYVFPRNSSLMTPWISSFTVTAWNLQTTPFIVLPWRTSVSASALPEWGKMETSGHKKKLHGLSPRVNYTDRATAACRRSDCQLVRIEGAMWLEWRIPSAVFSVF